MAEVSSSIDSVYYLLTLNLGGLALAFYILRTLYAKLDELIKNINELHLSLKELLVRVTIQYQQQQQQQHYQQSLK